MTAFPGWVNIAAAHAVEEGRRFGRHGKVAVVAKLMGAPQMSRVWDSLGKRFSSSEAVRDRLGSQYFGIFSSKDSESKLDVASVADDLFDEVFEASRGDVPGRKLTARKKAVLAKRIARLATELSSAVRAQRVGHFLYKERLDYKAISGWAVMHAAEVRDKYVRFFPRVDFGSFEIGSVVAMWSAVDHLPEMLDAVAGSALEWGKTVPLTPHPNDENASRLYFIRQMTKYFQAIYGQPLRENVLTLTAQFFECSDLTKSDITIAAPVKGRVKKKKAQ